MRKNTASKKVNDMKATLSNNRPYNKPPKSKDTKKKKKTRG